MIVLDQIFKVFHARDGAKVNALKDVSLTVDEREFITIVGPSGCGKSTLLRLVSGLIKPTSGTITINGSSVKEPLQDTGILFQTPVLLPWATIWN